MKRFKHFIKEFIDYPFPVNSQVLPTQTITEPSIKIQSDNPNISKMPIKRIEIKTLIIDFIKKLIRNSLKEIKLDEDDDFIYLIKGDIVFVKFDKDFDYVDKKIVVHLHTDLVNDEILDLKDQIELFQMDNPQIEFRVRSKNPL